MALGADKQAEIDSLRDVMAPTRRATVEALEAMLYDPVPVLDHGFIRLIDYMGDDAAIVQAAASPTAAAPSRSAAIAA